MEMLVRDEGYTSQRQQRWQIPSQEVSPSWESDNLPVDDDWEINRWYEEESSESARVIMGVTIQYSGCSIEPSNADSEAARLRRKFIQLRDEWKSSRGHEPSTNKLVMLPAYQKIIGMGPAVVPLLLRELQTNLDNWFWALMVITEENPVSEEARGDGEAMAQAWLKWGRERGYKW
jgi:hypothetical protein